MSLYIKGDDLMSDKMKVRQGEDGYFYPYTSSDLVVDKNGKSNATKFNEIDTQFKEKANLSEVRKKDTNITLNDCDSDMLGAIQGGEGTSFELLSVPRDGSVTAIKTDFIDIPLNRNLIDWNECIVDKIFSGNGNLMDKPIGWVSGLIKCNSEQKYVFSLISTNGILAMNAIYYFDINKAYLKQDTNVNIISTPPNCAFFQISLRYMTSAGSGANSGITSADLSSDFLWKKTKVQIGETPTKIEDFKLSSNIKVSYDTLEKEIQLKIEKGVSAYENKSTVDSWYKNKIMMSFGDSIVALGGWQPYVLSYFGCTNNYNRGVGGTTVANNGEKATLWDGTIIDGWMCGDDRINQMSPTNNDFLLILAGHNDWGFDIPIGEIGEVLVDTNFKSAYALMLKKIQAKFPNKPIICMTPINGRVHASGINQDIQEKNKIGLVMTDYANAVIDVCRHYSIPCIDLNTETGINVWNASTYLQDVIHPNSEGWKKVANCVINGMKRFEPIDLV